MHEREKAIEAIYRESNVFWPSADTILDLPEVDAYFLSLPSGYVTDKGRTLTRGEVLEHATMMFDLMEQNVGEYKLPSGERVVKEG